MKRLATWLRQHEGSCVVHVGAGLSTSAGIPDFRGKSGVWTKLLQEDHRDQNDALKLLSPIGDEDSKKKKIKTGHDERVQGTIKPFDETEPTVSHMILKELISKQYVDYIISQNVDGLFLKANLDRKFISELHGNFFLDECTRCRSRFIRGTASETMRLQRSSVACRRIEPPCKGHLRDTILDWESPVPFNELQWAERKAKSNKLHICIGTTMQLRPAKDLVCNPKKQKSAKLVIINLQPTQFDQMADMVINYYADDVMRLLADELGITEVLTYDKAQDPTKRNDLIGSMWRRK